MGFGAAAATRRDSSTRCTANSGPAALSTARRFAADTGRAEELAEEAFTRAYDRWGTLVSHPAPAAWVLRVVINLGIDDARRSQRMNYTDASVEIPDESAPTEDSSLTGIWVSDALAALPTKQRQAITLRYLVGCEEADIAAAIGVRPGTVKTHLKRGMARLRRELGVDTTLAVDLGS